MLSYLWREVGSVLFPFCVSSWVSFSTNWVGWALFLVILHCHCKECEKPKDNLFPYEPNFSVSREQIGFLEDFSASECIGLQIIFIQLGLAGGDKWEGGGLTVVYTRAPVKLSSPGAKSLRSISCDNPSHSSVSHPLKVNRH
jgi:hypothetical protein